MNNTYYSTIEDDGLLTQVLNPRDLLVSSTKYPITPQKFNDKIVGLLYNNINIDLDDGYDIEIYSQIDGDKIGNWDYICNEITASEDGGYILSQETLNKTFGVIVPLVLEGSMTDYPKLSNYLINADLMLKENINYLSLRVRRLSDKFSFDIENKLTLLINQLNGKIIKSDSNYQYIIPINSKYKEEINNFIEGKYSKLEDINKQKIIKFFNFKPDHLLYNVLYKTKSLKEKLEKDLDMVFDKDQELHSKPSKKEINII